MTLSRRKWAEEETRLALYLYFQLPFGQMHSRNPQIIELAKILNRPPSSVAMQLCNFASLDPKITSSGRKGLQGASAQAKRIWARFSDDWTALVEESERAWSTKTDEEAGSPSAFREEVSPFRFDAWEGPSTSEAFTKQRIGQGFFRRAVLLNFDDKCCITGIADPSLLNASHIKPWSKDIRNRHNPANGLCLSATFDRAFDRGLLTLDTSRNVVIADSLLNHPSKQTRAYFLPYHGVPIAPAVRFDLDQMFIDWHRNRGLEGA
jgi:putative restriction endonuclease